MAVKLPFTHSTPGYIKTLLDAGREEPYKTGQIREFLLKKLQEAKLAYADASRDAWLDHVPEQDDRLAKKWRTTVYNLGIHLAELDSGIKNYEAFLDTHPLT